MNTQKKCLFPKTTTVQLSLTCSLVVIFKKSIGNNLVVSLY